MNWVVFAVCAYVLLAMQSGLSGLLGWSLDWWGGVDVMPRLILMLPVLVGLFGPTHAAMVAFGVVGLCLDLLSPQVVIEVNGDGAARVQDSVLVTIIGPYTLGYLAAGYLMSQLRTMVYRENPITFGICVLAAGIAVHLVVVGFLSVRGWYDPIPGWSAKAALVERGLSVIYTAGIACVLAWPLLKVKAVFGFQVSKVRGR